MNAAAVISIPDDASLSDCEAVIEENLLAFVKTGLALQAIRERRLYRGVDIDGVTVETWTDYLRLRWDISRAHAGRLVNGAQTFELLAGVYGEENILHHERPLRPFVSEVPDNAKVAVWAVIQQTAPAGKIDGKHVALVVDTLAEIVRLQAVENGDGEQVRVNELVTAHLTKVIYERYQSERSYNDTVATPALYAGHALVVAVDGARVTLELQAEPALEDGQYVRLLVNEMRG
jgi:hypothetical protein